MSRALDKSIKEALRHGDHQKVYDEISTALTATWEDLLELEFLGKNHILDPDTTFLQDGSAIGIPKLRLIQAFVVARQILLGHTQRAKNTSREALRKATAVILATDPEHLTAANTRKRLLIDGEDETGLREELRRERYLIDSLLTSRLKRHTKSPILWNHRRWMLDRFKDHGIAGDVARDIRDIVFVSGDRHARNYYAWDHARYLAEGVDSATLRTILADTTRWCLAHPGDVSGWMFLNFLLPRARGDTEATIGEILQRVESYRWRNESVWYFLRNVLAQDPTIYRQDGGFQRVWEVAREGTEEGSKERRILDQTMSWLVSQHST